VVLLAVIFATQANDKPATPDTKGQFLDENTYNNPTLGLTVKLPGAWEFFTDNAQKVLGVKETPAPPDPSCVGPFCRADINAALITKAKPVPVASIFLTAYRIAPEFQDRRRYPLKQFAESMMTASVGGSGWTIDGELTPIKLDGRPAFRLLVQQMSSKGCGYVAESNSHVFMIIGVAPRTIPEKFGQIQDALEKMKFGPQTGK